MRWYYWLLVLIFCFAVFISLAKPAKHDYIITYSYIWTNGLIGFADVYKLQTSDSIGTIIAEGKTELMLQHHIPQPVLINITKVK